MKTYKGSIFLGLALAAALLVVSACSSSVSIGAGGSPTSSSLTPLQVLQNSAKAMQKLNSVHFVTTSNGSFQANNAGTPTTAATPVTNNSSVNIKASGDAVLPNQEKSQITLNQSINLAEVVTADKVYIQNTKGQWYVLDKSTLQAYANGNPFAGVNLPDMKDWMALLQHIQLRDHGTEALNGQNLRHITATLDKDSLRQLLTSNGQMNSAFGKQNIDSVLNSAKSLIATLDVWIDESTFYVHRTELKFNLNADLSSLRGASGTPTATATVTVPSNVTTTLDSIVDLSKFNEPVTITPPANAIPTDNPLVIFGGQ
jgi:LppX/LprAFG-like lipoprotein